MSITSEKTSGARLSTRRWKKVRVVSISLVVDGSVAVVKIYISHSRHDACSILKFVRLSFHPTACMVSHDKHQ